MLVHCPSPTPATPPAVYRLDLDGSSTVTFTALQQALKLLPKKTEAPAVKRKHKPSPKELVAERKALLLDSTRHRANKDPFSELDSYLKTHNMKLRELFDEFDTDRSGALDRNEIKEILLKLIPTMSSVEVKYFQVMMDIEQTHTISYYKLISVIKDMRTVGLEAETKGAFALARVYAFALKSKVNIKHVFDACDGDEKGLLTRDELINALRELMPSITVRDLRLILAYLYKVDVRVGAGAPVPSLTLSTQ